MLNIDVEHALEKASPAHTRRSPRVLEGPFTGFLGRARQDRSVQFGVPGEQPVDADVM